MLKTTFGPLLLVFLGLVGCAAPTTDAEVQTSPRSGPEPALVPATPGDPPQPENLPVPRRDEAAKFAVPSAPRPEAELPVAPIAIGPRGEGVGSTSQGLSTQEGIGWQGGAVQALYMADGSGANAIGAYPVTATIYNAFTGNKYYVSGPGTLNEEGYEILLNLASRMYWDCELQRRDAVLSGYSRGVYNVLEAHRWATAWGCAPRVVAALFVDPVDTLIWGYNHTVPDGAPTRIVRKNWWYNAWAFVFANGAVYGGQQYIREEGVTHGGFGWAQWAAEDLETYGNWFLGDRPFAL